MQAAHSSGSGSGIGAGGRYRRRRPADPVTLLCERIRGQGEPSRLRLRIQPLPVDVGGAVDPGFEQTLLLAADQPGVHQCLDVVIVAQPRQGLAAQARVAGVERVDIPALLKEPLELVPQLGHRAHDAGQTRVHRLARDLQRVGDLREPVVAERKAGVEQPARLVAQARIVLRRQQHQERPRHGGRYGHGCDVLLDDQIRVRAARAEGRHAGDARPCCARRRHVPGRRCALQPERTALESDMRVDVLRMQRRRQPLVLELEQDLGHAGDASGRFQMPEVALHRADRAEAALGSGVAERLGQRVDFDRISELCAGAVGLHERNVAGADPGFAEGGLHQFTLRRGIGRGVAFRPASVIDAAGADHTVDVVAVGDRARQALEDQYTHALAGHETVAAFAETPATSRCR